MAEETRAGFDEMRLGFDEMRRGFAAIDRRFESIDRRFESTDDKIRGLGVLTEDLRKEIQVVAEGVKGNEQAIGRLETTMNARFRENEIVVHAAFRQIRLDIEELRDRH